MKRTFTDRPIRDFKQGINKIYKNREGDILNEVVSTPAKTIIINQRTTARIVGNNDNIDAAKFRSGVEISDPIFRMRGNVDISCGYDSHIHEQLTLGQSWEHEGNNYFVDNKQQPMTMISALHSGSGDHTVALNFHKVRITNDFSVKFRETAKNMHDTKLISNGVIQIFDNNSYFSSTIDEYDVSIRNAAPNRIIKQTSIKSQHPNRDINTMPFVDQLPNTLTIQKSIISSIHKPLEGTNTVIGMYGLFDGHTKLKALSIGNKNILLYNNTVIPRGTLYVEQETQDFFDDSAIVHKTTRLSDNMNNLMANTMLIMSGTGDTDDYVADNMKSAATGFTFDNATFGTDSIAFR